MPFWRQSGAKPNRKRSRQNKTLKLKRPPERGLGVTEIESETPLTLLKAKALFLSGAGDSRRFI